MSPELKALVILLRYVLSPRMRRAGNQYTQGPVVDALKTVAAATGQSTQGYDYLDALDNLTELQTRGELPQTLESQ